MAVIRVCHPHSPVSELVQGGWRWMHGTALVKQSLQVRAVFLGLLSIPCNSLL